MAEKIVSQLDADLYFTGATIADESPLEPGVFLLPAGAVDMSPPQVPSGKRARFNGGMFVFEELPKPAEPEPEPEPTPEQVRRQYVAAVQMHMDNAARAAGYDDIKSAVTYADEPAVPKFQREGQAFRAWRSLCWAYCYDQLDLVMSGQRERPTIEQLVAELPAIAL